MRRAICLFARSSSAKHSKLAPLADVSSTAAAAAIAAAPALSVRNTQRTVSFWHPLLRLRAARLLSLLRLERYALDVWVTNDITMRRLNKQYRGLDKTTDVLSFPFQQLQPPETDVPPEERPLPPAFTGNGRLCRCRRRCSSCCHRSRA